MLTGGRVASGVLAGIMISIGGCVYLAVDNKYIGAVLFTVALLTICLKGYSLYTGRIGFIPESHSREDVSVLLLGLLGNTIATTACGHLARYALARVGEAAYAACSSKLTQSFGETLVRAIFCGVLMYIAVSIYREKQSIVGVLFAIPVFILAGFEHSIADIFYFASSGIVSLRAFGFICTVILGNSVGAMLMPAFAMIGKDRG